MNQESEFYLKLKERLKMTTVFPTKYLYKFIVPAGEKVSEIGKIFENIEKKMKLKYSKNQKYVSISIEILEKNEQEIVERYESVRHIKGIITL